MHGELQKPSSGDLDRLRKCVLMLSSEHDGEVLSAARSINRILAAIGLDWHWLISRLNAPPGPAAGRSTAFAGDHQLAARWLLDSRGSALREKDRDFLETMTVWRGAPSEKQAVWLVNLCQRYGYRP